MNAFNATKKYYNRRGVCSGRNTTLKRKRDDVEKENRPRKYAANYSAGVRSKPVRKGKEPNRLYDIYVNEFPPQMQNLGENEMKEILEKIAEVKLHKFTHKGSFGFLQVQGKDFDVALERLNSANMTAQRAQANRGCDVKEFKLSEYLHTIAKQNSVSPLPEPKQFHLLERALRTLHVSNIPLEAGEEDLEKLFVEYGRIQTTTLINDKKSSAGQFSHAGFGFVFFEKHDDAMKVFTSSKPFLLFEQHLSIQTSRPPAPVRTIAHAAGLVDNDCNPTRLMVNLLEASKAQTESMFTSFSQKRIHLLQPSTGHVRVIKETDFPLYEYYIATGQLIQISNRFDMKPVGLLPVQATPIQMQSYPPAYPCYPPSAYLQAPSFLQPLQIQTLNSPRCPPPPASVPTNQASASIAGVTSGRAN